MNKEREHKKIVWSLALASFFHDMGSDIVFSLWPFFVTSILGANMTILGFIDGVGDALVSASQAVSGYISDRIRKRKIFVWLGYLFGGLARIGYALSPTWYFLIPFRIFDRSGKMRDAPRDAIVSDISTRNNRGNNFGILRAMDNFGAVVGILIAVFLLGILGYRTLFALAAIPSLIAVILIIVFIRERKSAGQLYKGVSIRKLDRNLQLFFLLNTIFALGSFSYSFLLIYAKNYGFQIGFTPLLYLLFTLVAAVFSLPFGRLSDKIGRKKVLFAAFFFWMIVAALLILSRNFWTAIIAFVFYGLHKAALDPSQKTLTAELAPNNYVASTMGGFQMITGLAALPASLIAGLLWDRIGMTVPLYFSLGLTIIASGMLLLVKETSFVEGERR